MYSSVNPDYPGRFEDTGYEPSAYPFEQNSGLARLRAAVPSVATDVRGIASPLNLKRGLVGASIIGLVSPLVPTMAEAVVRDPTTQVAETGSGEHAVARSSFKFDPDQDSLLKRLSRVVQFDGPEIGSNAKLKDLDRFSAEAAETTASLRAQAGDRAAELRQTEFSDVSLDDMGTKIGGRAVALAEPVAPSIPEFAHASAKRAVANLQGQAYVEMPEFAKPLDLKKNPVPADASIDPADQPGKIKKPVKPAKKIPLEAEVKPATKSKDHASDIVFPVVTEPEKIKVEKSDGNVPLIRAPKNTPVVAPDDSTVVSVQNNKKNRDEGTVVVLEDNDTQERYIFSGLGYNSAKLNVGQQVDQQQVIGAVGTKKDNDGTTPGVEFMKVPASVEGFEITSKPLCFDNCGSLLTDDAFTDLNSARDVYWQQIEEATGEPAVRPLEESVPENDVSAEVPNLPKITQKIEDFGAFIKTDLTEFSSELNDKGALPVFEPELDVNEDADDNSATEPADDGGIGAVGESTDTENGKQAEKRDQKDTSDRQKDEGEDKDTGDPALSGRKIVDLKGDGTLHDRVLVVAQEWEERGMSPILGIATIDLESTFDPDAKNPGSGYLGLAQTKGSFGRGSGAKHRAEALKAESVPKDMISEVYPAMHQIQDAADWFPDFKPAGIPLDTDDPKEMETFAMKAQGVNYINNPHYDNFDREFVPRAKRLLEEARAAGPSDAAILK